MNEQERALLFTRQLDLLLAGKATDAILISSDQQALDLARCLITTNFSNESNVQHSLRLHLVQVSMREGNSTAFEWIKSLFEPINRVNFTTWGIALVVLFLTLLSPLSSKFKSGFIEHDIPSTNELISISINSVTDTNPLSFPPAHPVPIPTPLAIPAAGSGHNHPSPTIRANSVPFSKNGLQTQTPKPIPVMPPSARP